MRLAPPQRPSAFAVWSASGTPVESIVSFCGADIIYRLQRIRDQRERESSKKKEKNSGPGSESQNRELSESRRREMDRHSGALIPNRSVAGWISSFLRDIPVYTGLQDSSGYLFKSSGQANLLVGHIVFRSSC